MRHPIVPADKAALLLAMIRDDRPITEMMQATGLSMQLCTARRKALRNGTYERGPGAAAQLCWVDECHEPRVATGKFCPRHQPQRPDNAARLMGAR